MSRRIPKFEVLVVNAIRRLQGSTANEIANYLQHKYDVGGADIRRQIFLTLKRGVNYGIIEKSKRGYTTCDQNTPDSLEPQDVSDCYNCRRSARRSRGMKRGHRDKRGSRKSSSHKRMGKRRSSTRKRASTKKMAKSPRKHTDHQDAAKSKNSKSQDIPPYGRHDDSNSNRDRSSSKSPSRSGDIKRET